MTRKENADPILPGGNVSASQETSQIKDQPTASTSSNKGKKKKKESRCDECCINRYVWINCMHSLIKYVYVCNATDSMAIALHEIVLKT